MRNTIFAVTALFSFSAAQAATPEQAELARQCAIDPEVIEFSLSKADILARFETDITHVSKGDGEIQIIEFFDYSCPRCQAYNPVFSRLVEENPDVRVDLVEYPIYGRTFVSRVTGNKTLNVTHFALASAEIDEAKYIAFHDTMMQTGGRPTDNKIKYAASEVGLDYEALSTRSKSDDMLAISNANLDYAESLGVKGTPAVIVNGIILSHKPWDYKHIDCLVGAARDEQG